MAASEKLQAVAAKIAILEKFIIIPFKVNLHTKGLKEKMNLRFRVYIRKRPYFARK